MTQHCRHRDADVSSAWGGINRCEECQRRAMERIGRSILPLVAVLAVTQPDPPKPAPPDGA